MNHKTNRTFNDLKRILRESKQNRIICKHGRKFLAKESKKFINPREVQEKLDDKINDLFAELQNKYGIEYGDVSPSESFELEERMNGLVEIIVRILNEELHEE